MRRFYRKVPKKSSTNANSANKRNEMLQQFSGQNENLGGSNNQSNMSGSTENDQKLSSSVQHIMDAQEGNPENQKESQNNGQPITDQQNRQIQSNTQNNQNQPLVSFSQTNNQHVQLQPDNPQGNQNREGGQANQADQTNQAVQINQDNQFNQNNQANQNNQSNQPNQANQLNQGNGQGNQPNQANQSNQGDGQGSQSNQNNQAQDMQNSQSQQPNHQKPMPNTDQNVSAQISVPIYKKLEDNIEYIKKILGNPYDLVVRELRLELFEDDPTPDQQTSTNTQLFVDEKNEQTVSKIQCSILYISGLANSKIVDDNILRTLQEKARDKQFKENPLEQINQEVIAITNTKKINTFQQVIDALLCGSSIFMIEGEKMALEMGTAGAEKRSLEESQSETVIRGSRISFIEDIDTNISLLRRELKDPNLRIESYEVGRRSNQRVAVCYVEGITNPDILDEVKRRLKTIDIDFVPDSGIVEQWIEDSPLSPFPQVLDSERPDRVSYNLMQGKVVIFLDGSPSAIVTPITVGDAFLTVEDFSQRWIVASSMRLLRFFSVLIALFLPGLYVALTSFHPGMLPTQLILAITAAREGVPFPALIEVLLMAVTFEILQEAGIRLPKPIGQTVGIVGGVVIGDVAVSAGIVGPALVIITSLTAMSSFTIPNYSTSISFRILRFIFVIAASILGLYGIILVFIMLCIHVVNLKSMGIPYSAPIAPYFLDSLNNLVIRTPITTLKRRPPYLEPLDLQKVNSGGQRQ